MAAQNKDELLAVTDKEFSKLKALLVDVDAEAAMEKREDDTSIKDVVAHRAHWIVLFLGWYRDGLAGKEVHFPAKGFKWNELKTYNEELRQKQVSLDWVGAKRRLMTNHKKLVKFIAEHSNAELYGGPMKGAKNNWTPGRWAEAAGPSHYRSAAKFVRACLR